MRHLLALRRIDFQDGDGCIPTTRLPYRTRLSHLERNGLFVAPLTLIHYTTPFFRSRHAAYVRRLENALNDIAPNVHPGADRTPFMLTAHEDAELRTRTSEVVAVGLANFVLCEALGANLNAVNKIVQTGVRCDYEIRTRRVVAVYEAKGRGRRADIRVAARELPRKKGAHRANLKYGLFSELPRARPATVWIYDPPGDELPPPSDRELELRVAEHYARIAVLARQPEIARMLRARIRLLAEGPAADADLIGFDARGWELERATHAVRAFTGEPLPAKSRRGPVEPGRAPPFALEFDLDRGVIADLRSWRVDRLIDRPGEARIDRDRFASMASDGSILRIVARERKRSGRA